MATLPYKSIIETCRPLEALLKGNLNLEIFTASLTQIMDHYRGKKSAIDNVYTDPVMFFSKATYPTFGLKQVINDVFGRLAGDLSCPAIHALETSFGGGKTHTLIALTHIAHHGKKIAAHLNGIVNDPKILGDPNEVYVVGIAGEDLSVHKNKGKDLIAHTLWGEMAMQLGGEALYNSVRDQAESYAFEGSRFFDKVIGEKKVLIMIDELAQYCTRLEAAHTGGGDLVASFMMSLHTYARNHSNVSVVLTLASVSDAFSKQTENLRKMIAKIKGVNDVSEAKAHSIAKKAIDGAISVKSRDADSIVPVQASEISCILAKRLFDSIDYNAAQDTVSRYVDMYEKHSYMLPERYVLSALKESMLVTYPFHATFVNFLNDKMAMLETFQGTRGVLRTLAVTIRSIWEKKLNIPMIHTCHLDLRDTRTVNELLGRNQCTELIPIIHADIGSADTASMALGMSMAESLDRKNPHPLNLSLYEYTWRTVFLNSLVGRSEGTGSNIFGVNEKEAVLQTAFPGMPPAQVEAALKAIPDTALYLKYRQGKYYASLDPTIVNILLSIKKGINKDQALEILGAACRKIIRPDAIGFNVVNEKIEKPEDIPDRAPKPILAVVDINTERVNVEKMVTLAGENKARINQNLVFVLVPDIVAVEGEAGSESLFKERENSELKDEIIEIAKDLKARQMLKARPQQYGLTEKHLREDDYEGKLRERENALQIRVSQRYNSLYYPATTGKIVKKEIKTAGGESGASFEAQILRILKEAGELITSDVAESVACLSGIARLFFDNDATPEVKKIYNGFSQKRHWPILENANIFEQIMRAGVKKGFWCLFKMGGQENTRPEIIYHREKYDIPYEIDLTQPEWSLISYAEATKRSWIGTQVDKLKVEDFVKEVLSGSSAMQVKDIVSAVKDGHGVADAPSVVRAVEHLVTTGKFMSYNGRPDQKEKPSDLKAGSTALMYQAGENSVIISPAEAAKRGWMSVESKNFVLEGSEAAEAILPLIKNIGSLYSKGAKSSIDFLDISNIQLKKGGNIQIRLDGATPESLKDLGEFFQVLSTLIGEPKIVEAYLRIEKPDETCEFYKKLTSKGGK